MQASALPRSAGLGAVAGCLTTAAQVFEWVGRDPIASASIAQVHRARLRDTHKEVVVKVQHDGVDALMLHDLETVRLLTIAIVKLEPDLDFRPLLDAWCAEVPKELDFRIEAQNMAEVSANLSAAGGCGAADGGGAGDPALEVDVLLPRVVPELTSRRLLVMSYEEGARLTEPPSVTRTGVDVGEFIRAVARAYAQQMFIDGVYNADPREPLKRLAVPTAAERKRRRCLQTPATSWCRPRRTRGTNPCCWTSACALGWCRRCAARWPSSSSGSLASVRAVRPQRACWHRSLQTLFSHALCVRAGPEQNAEARATLFEAFSEMVRAHFPCLPRRPRLSQSAHWPVRCRAGL